MLFIGVALLIVAALTLLIVADAGSLVGLTQYDTARVIPLVLLLCIFAGGAFSRRRQLGELLSGLVLWACIFGVVIVGYAYRDELGGIASRVAGEFSPSTAMVSSSGDTVSFRRGNGGSFFIGAQVNERDLQMIFDTGATAVVLTHEDAIRAGIDVDALAYNVQVQTANGIGWAARTRVDQIQIGSIYREDLSAYVAAEDALTTSLLGMSFLETLSSYTVSGNELQLVN